MAVSDDRRQSIHVDDVVDLRCCGYDHSPRSGTASLSSPSKRRPSSLIPACISVAVPSGRVYQRQCLRSGARVARASPAPKVSIGDSDMPHCSASGRSAKLRISCAPEPYPGVTRHAHRWVSVRASGATCQGLICRSAGSLSKPNETGWEPRSGQFSTRGNPCSLAFRYGRECPLSG